MAHFVQSWKEVWDWIDGCSQYPAQLPPAVQKDLFGNVNSLISFVLSDSDAKVVRRELLRPSKEKGTESIPESELQRLRVGEAYMKLDYGFAIKVRVLPPLIQEYEAKEVIERSRERYQGEHVVAEEIRDVLISEEKEYSSAPETPTIVSTREKVVENAEPSPGRGGPEHVYLQSLLKQYGEDHGFKASIERELPDGGRVDVALERKDMRIACETVSQPVGSMK